MLSWVAMGLSVVALGMTVRSVLWMRETARIYRDLADRREQQRASRASSLR